MARIPALLILDLSGPRRGAAYFRWQAIGLLLLNGVILVSNFAQGRRWLTWQSGKADLIEVALVLLGFALLTIGFVKSHDSGEIRSDLA